MMTLVLIMMIHHSCHPLIKNKLNVGDNNTINDNEASKNNSIGMKYKNLTLLMKKWTIISRHSSFLFMQQHMIMMQ